MQSPVKDTLTTRSSGAKVGVGEGVAVGSGVGVASVVTVSRAMVVAADCSMSFPVVVAEASAVSEVITGAEHADKAMDVTATAAIAALILNLTDLNGYPTKAVTSQIK